MAADLRSDLLGAPTAVARLWFSILAGPVAWLLQLLISYPLAQLSCHAEFRSQHPLTLQAIALGALLIAGAGAMTAWQARESAPGDASPSGGRAIDRARFMAGLGLLSATLFALVIIATAIPTWIVHACQ
jgi:hypothetical protein